MGNTIRNMDEIIGTLSINRISQILTGIRLLTEPKKVDWEQIGFVQRIRIDCVRNEPHIYPYSLYHQKAVYSIFFTCVASTLKDFGLNPKNLGAEIGMTMVLHTNNRKPRLSSSRACDSARRRCE